MTAPGRRIVVAALLLVPGGCGPRHPGERIREGIVDGRTGESAAFQALIDDLAAADVVFVGEDHDNPRHHEVEQRIAQALLEKKPDLAFGMEMLHADVQGDVDRYLAGAIDREGLKRAVQWDRTWGFPFSYYSPLFELSRDRRVPLFALNAPESVVSLVRQHGVKGLSPEEKARLPEMDLSNEEHRSFVREFFEGHHDLPEDRFEKFYAVQVLWDETMAERTVQGMRRHPGSTQVDADRPAKEPMLVFAGTGHLIRRLGIPSRVERRVPGVRMRVVLAMSVDTDEVKEAVAEKDADWLWITPDVERASR